MLGMNGATEPNSQGTRAGALSWMARNPVAANLFMVVLIVGGLVVGRTIKQEVFPEFELDLIAIAVPYPGASPGEVEEGVILAIEEAVRGLDGVKTVYSNASEGVGTVTVEVLRDADVDDVLSDVRGAVDRITSFPEDAERPDISMVSARNQVISLVLYGDLGERTEHILRELAYQARGDLLQDDRITLVEVDGIRPLEISIEVPQENLRAYGLTLDQVAMAVRRGSIDLPGGGVKTESGEILIRTTERRDRAAGFESIVVLSQPDGTQVTVGDIGTVIDGFRDTDEETSFNGQPAVRVNVFRVGDQTPITVADAVKEYVQRLQGELPPGVQVSEWADASEIYRDRIDLLMRNAYIGLVLVLLTLGLFLSPRLAFWVTLGIPISFLGTLLILPSVDVSINMISLFAFILTIGIVVDDAIIVGEAIFSHRQEGMPVVRAAIAGVHEVAGPVVFSILTTVVAFMPMLFVPGMMGKLFYVIPATVITILLISLFESLFILPAHLAHSKRQSPRGILGWLTRGQQAFNRQYQKFIERVYVPSVRLAVRIRGITVAWAVATLIVTVGFVAGGRLDFTFMPKVESDIIQVGLQMPFGTPVEVTRAHQERILAAADQVFEELGSEEAHSRGVFAQLGGGLPISFGPRLGNAGSGGHLANVAVFLVRSDDRPFTARQFTERWREVVGEIPGAEALTFQFSTGPSSQAPIDIELSHDDLEVLEHAAVDLAAALREYSGVIDINDGFEQGKPQLDLTVRPEARTLGVDPAQLARQLRAAFFGEEAARQQRGRDELRVYVRLPEEQRTSEYDIESFLVRNPAGGEIPLVEAAQVDRGYSFTRINRRDGRRVINVTADVEEGEANANVVLRDLREGALPSILANYPGLSYRLAGMQEEQQDALGSLLIGGVLALLGMFALMAIAFRSYIQPAIVMFAIPFGVVGAVAGHVIMGYDLSLISMLGIVALAGVVVNDSLVLITAINRYRAAGMTAEEATVTGGRRRFRPIMLTSLTTFFGLAPMIWETSVQARFLIPMAISLGFGVLFSTFVTLVLVPSTYMLVEDVRRFFARIGAYLRVEEASPPAEETG